MSTNVLMLEPRTMPVLNQTNRLFAVSARCVMVAAMGDWPKAAVVAKSGPTKDIEVIDAVIPAALGRELYEALRAFHRLGEFEDQFSKQDADDYERLCEALARYEKEVGE